ncbi:NUDIX domain-containing protein [Nonomuraea turkmeniaca]|uniref:NUDIX domain-containing protein n=1 Tax=Nonomuraea turkmeniaca TaxID=103838 RepID=A0A5S4F875_9ACTN|nr:NUDIX domain-containing protein [Nonomuraea turkmeniaca]TMR12418.1 NUDIX domain-containing protein [Nonomuraea turkmeniaca]
MSDVVPRPSARVVVIDDADRLLLFSSHNRHDGSARWFTPGGGLQAGENHQGAALRELYEETGLTGVRLGPEVWRGRPWTVERDGVTYEVRQRYYLARVPAFEIDTARMEDFEKASITGHRWWTLKELGETTDLLRPAGLPHLLARLLADGPPRHPILVNG